MLIEATIGSEAHTTSSGWAKITVNGKKFSFRDATSAKWLTKFGDKHSSWCECIFSVPEGAEILWEAGRNSGNRGSNRARLALTFLANGEYDYVSEDLGHPCRGQIRGKLRLVGDKHEIERAVHATLKEQV